MVFVTGPLCSGKRTFAQKLGGRQVYDVQDLADAAADLNGLADELADYDVVPVDKNERAAREAAGRLACLLAARADCVVQMFCGLPTILKGELPKC